jgi:aldose 1-epimerase
MKQKRFGRLPDGTDVPVFTLNARNGASAEVIPYGATLVSLSVPDRNGRMDDVVLGFRTLEDYLAQPWYVGAAIGRFGNRIAEARFTLGGREFRLAANAAPNHLHGGVRGFDKRVWAASDAGGPEGEAVRFSLTSPDGEEGYPGALRVDMTYRLGHDASFRIEYVAVTDLETVVNLTHHSYFNLAGEGRCDILRHRLEIEADHYTPVSDRLIPTGALESVAGTPLDFTKPTAVGDRIASPHAQIEAGGGYDHNFVLRKAPGAFGRAATAREDGTGRVMEVWTTEPGIQFYSGNFLDGSLRGKRGAAYGRRTGFCLETQHFPDSPNQPGFPSTVLKPGETYRSVTEYRFRAGE